MDTDTHFSSQGAQAHRLDAWAPSNTMKAKAQFPCEIEVLDCSPQMQCAATLLASSATQLRNDVDRLVQRHRSDLNSYLERWLQQVRHTELSQALPGQVPIHSGPSSLQNLSPEPKFGPTSSSTVNSSVSECQSSMETESLGSPHMRTKSPTIQSCATTEFSKHVCSHSFASKLPGSPRQGHWAKQGIERLCTMASLSDGVSRAAFSRVMPTTNMAQQQVALEVEAKHKQKSRPKRTWIRTPANDQKTETSRWRALIDSRCWEWTSGSLIFANALFIGLQTEVLASRAKRETASGSVLTIGEPLWMIFCQAFFCTAFFFELAFRWASKGFRRFFQVPDIGWNLMDIFIVVFSLIDFSFSLATVGGACGLELTEFQNISVLRVVRVIRVIRVVKVIRVMHFFRDLRMMVLSILKSIKALLWVVLVLVLTFYLFGIVFTSATTSHLMRSEDWSNEMNQGLILYFGSLGDSMLNLFMAMAGGRDWGDHYDVIKNLHGLYHFIFLVFITFTLFAVVNIVTGVFVESATQSQKADRDILVHEELQAKKRYLESMHEVFNEIEEDGSGCIGLEEFESKLDDERVIAYFNALKLDVSDATMLFRLLDRDNSGEVNIHEFLTGCYTLQGESRSLDMKIMQLDVHHLQEGVAQCFNLMTDLHYCLTMKQDDLSD